MRHNKKKVKSKGALTLGACSPQQGRVADKSLLTLATPPAGVARGAPACHLAVYVQEALPPKLVTGRGQGAGAHSALEAGPGVSIVAGGTRGHRPPALAPRLPRIAWGTGLAREASVTRWTETLFYKGRPAQSSVPRHSSLQLYVLDSDIDRSPGEVLGSDQDHLNIGQAVHQITPVCHLASRTRVRAETGKPETVVRPETDRNLIFNIRTQIIYKVHQSLVFSLKNVHLNVRLFLARYHPTPLI